MTQTYIALPNDGGGKKVRARSRSEGGQTVYEQYVIAALNDRIRTCVQSFVSAANAYTTAAASAGTSPHCVENDVGSSVLIAITRIIFQSQISGAAALPSAPRVIVKRFTFTGTPSGSVVTGGAFDSNDTAKSSSWNVRSATTGMTVTEAGTVHAFMPIAAATGVGVSTPSLLMWEARPNCPLIVRAGEGVLLRQSSAGGASENRVWIATFEIEEFTGP